MPITRSNSPSVLRAKSFLRGEAIAFGDANRLWKQLKREDELSLARAVLERIRKKSHALLDRVPPENRQQLCQQHAELTSKDPELNSALRHDQALEILDEGFDLKSAALDGDGETLGVAGGIYKRRWTDLGQLKDLQQAAKLYERALLLEPTRTIANNNLAVILSVNDNIEEAMKHAVAALRSSPNDPELLDTLGSIQIKAGAYKAAAATYQRAADIDPLNPRWRQWLDTLPHGAQPDK